MPAKKKTAAQDEYVSYLVEIETWDWSFSFGINRGPYRSGPFSDYRHLKITGPLISPIIDKVEAVTLLLIPDKVFNRENWDNAKTDTVGSLSLRGGKLEGLLSLPDDALAPIISALGAEALRFVTINGRKLQYRNSVVHYFHLDRTYDPVDFPEV